MKFSNDLELSLPILVANAAQRNAISASQDGLELSLPILAGSIGAGLLAARLNRKKDDTTIEARKRSFKTVAATHLGVDSGINAHRAYELHSLVRAAQRNPEIPQYLINNAKHARNVAAGGGAILGLGAGALARSAMKKNAAQRNAIKASQDLQLSAGTGLVHIKRKPRIVEAHRAKRTFAQRFSQFAEKAGPPAGRLAKKFGAALKNPLVHSIGGGLLAVHLNQRKDDTQNEAGARAIRSVGAAHLGVSAGHNARTTYKLHKALKTATKATPKSLVNNVKLIRNIAAVSSGIQGVTAAALARSAMKRNVANGG